MDSDIRQLIWDRAKKYYPVKASHGLNHIEDNLNMAEKMLAFAKEPFTDQIYAAIVFHDSGLEKYGREIHEIHSAEIAKRELKDLFNSKDLFLIAAAIKEHRASFKGTFTSMLSDICSSADRNVPNFEASVARSFLYTSEHHPEFSFEEKCETVAKHLNAKYGTNGYARFPIYYSRYYRNDLREYQRKMDALTGDVVAKVVGNNGKNAEKLYDKALESLLDRDALNVVETKMYFANNNGKIPKDANGNTVLVKNVIDATIYAAFDQFNDSKVAMACKGFMQYKNGTNKHVLVVHGDDSLTEPEELDCVGTIYSVTLSEPIEFRYHGHRGFGKCQLPKIYTVKEEALKDAKIEKADVVNFKATFEYEKSLTMQHATESLSENIASNIVNNKVYHASPKKLEYLGGKASKTKDAKGSVFVSPFKHFASMFIFDFQGIVDEIEAQIGKKHIKIDNFGFEEWNTKPSSTTSVPSKVHILVRTPESFKSFKGKATGYLYTIDFNKYKDKADMWTHAKDSDVELIIRSDVHYEKCEEITMEYEVIKDTRSNATEDLDISATLLQEFNAGIEEFNRWIRDLSLLQLKKDLNDPQVDLVFSQIAQESILVDTVKTIFRKIGEFIAWFFRKLKELWNYFFGKTQRGMRALKSANDLITKHKNSNGFFNDAAFEAAKVPQGLVNAVGLDQFLTTGFSPDMFSGIFNEMLDMWASRPEELYEEVFVKFNQAPTSHKWHYILAYLPTKPGPDGMDGMKYAKTKHPATGTMRESSYDRESVFILLKEAMDAYVAYEKNSKLIASRGNVTADAARRMIEYQDRTDITEREAIQLAKDIQELGAWMQVVFKSYQSGFEFILQQMNMVTNVYTKYMK